MIRNLLLIICISFILSALSSCATCPPEHRGKLYSRTPDRVAQTIENVHYNVFDGEQGEMPVGEEDITR